MTLAVSYRPIEQLAPYKNNPRTHSREQVDAICASISQFGWTNPVLIDGDNSIVAGHGRVLAARKLGMGLVPCIELRDLTDAQRQALVIADNQLALRAGWDVALLRIELEGLQELDFDLAPIGFDEAELISILSPESMTDPEAEWSGMPEFDHKDKTAFRSLIVHFNDQAEVDKFAALISQNIGPNQKSLWYPEAEIETYVDKRYASES